MSELSNSKFRPILALALASSVLSWQVAGQAHATPEVDETASQERAIAGTVTDISQEEAEGIIFERQQIMLQLEKDSDLLGDIIAGLAPKEKLAETARAIADGAKDTAFAFEDIVPGGRSKPEVWSDREAYMNRMDAFVQNAENMAVLAEGGDLNAVMSVMADALPCKQCHDVYRAPKPRFGNSAS